MISCQNNVLPGPELDHVVNVHVIYRQIESEINVGSPNIGLGRVRLAFSLSSHSQVDVMYIMYVVLRERERDVHESTCVRCGFLKWNIGCGRDDLSNGLLLIITNFQSCRSRTLVNAYIYYMN